jgi:hypothetical protein
MLSMNKRTSWCCTSRKYSATVRPVSATRRRAPGEDRVAAVLQRDVVDQLHDEHGLADARPAEEARLAPFHVRLEKVDDLDAGLEHLDFR